MARLEAAASLHGGELGEIINKELNEIRRAISREETRELRSVDLGERIDLNHAANHGLSASDYFVDFGRELPAGPGLVLDERFLFIARRATIEVASPEEEGAHLATEGLKSEVGLRIYRTTREDTSTVVVFTADEGWYGESPQRAIAELATAVTHIFGLDPQATAFVERWTVGSGHTKRGHDEVELVRLAYDRSTERFHSPAWEAKESLEAILEKLGGIA